MGVLLMNSKLSGGLRQGNHLSPFLFLIVVEGPNVMINALVDTGLFTGYKVGASDLVSITHLQFVDDILLVGTRNWANIRTLKVLLLFFEGSSSLKVNFHKSILFVINIYESWLTEASFILRCKMGRLHFLYLGIPVGGDSRKLNFWHPLIDRIESRLSGWNSINLSLGGRLVLLSHTQLSFFPSSSLPHV